MRLAHILPLLAALLLPACDTLMGSEEHELLLYVAPYTQECVGVDVQQCMLVKEHPEDDWEFFYDGIEGFTYEPGYNYSLLVGWREIDNPPADGSSRRYRLIRLVQKTPASPAPPGG